MPENNSGNLFQKQRRKLLKLMGLSSAVLAAESVSAQIRVGRETENTRRGINYISLIVLRPEDLLSLELRYYNFNFSGNTLQKKGNPAYVAVIFQPQSMSEQAWNETEAGLQTPTIPGRMMIGGESRLVFEIPASITSIALKLEDLLAWERYTLVVNDRAKEAPAGRVARPNIPVHRQAAIQRNVSARDTNARNLNTRGVNKNMPVIRGATKSERKVIGGLIMDTSVRENSRNDAIVNLGNNIRELTNDAVGPVSELQTALEVPMRLYLSPTKRAGWAHEAKLIAGKGIIKETNKLFELWHSRMGVKLKNGTIDESENTNEQRILRALWADDAKKGFEEEVIVKTDPYLLNTSLSNKDRHQLVHESSNFLIQKYLPPPIRARKLFLSTLGAWLTSEFIVERNKLEAAGILKGTGTGNALNVLSWKHIATMGREHYVEIVKAGNIMPFGNEAVLVTITERKPHGGTGTAANFKREFVIITEPIKGFDYRDERGIFMNFCFSRIEFVTTVSPSLDKPKIGLVTPTTGVMNTENQFIIKSNGAESLFKIKAEDLDGNLVDFSLPIAFVSTDIQDNGDNIKALVAAYNNAFSILKIAPINGQKFTLAPQIENGCDTTYVASDISFQVMKYLNSEEPQGFLPTIGQTKIIEPSYQKLTGIAQPVYVSLIDDKNDGHVFAKFNSSQGVNFGGQSDKTGGLATPNFNLTGLSKVAGAFGGNLDKFKTASASADDFFNVSSIPDPKLFGAFKLSEILNFVNGDKSSYDLAKPLLNRVPKVPNLSTEETDKEFITSYVINSQLQEKDLTIAAFKPQPGASFSIVTQVKTKKDNPVDPVFSTNASVKNFNITILGDLIGIHFNAISFITDAGKKPDVVVDMPNNPIVFGGPLSFINAFNSLIPSDGFVDPPYLDVSLTGIKCGYTLSLPNLQLGAFTLSNLSLGAEVNLPFTGAPLTVGFRFCERQQPFTLTYSCLGGGGFFGLELDLNGIRQIEAALEFGAAASINLGVASGSVSIMAGIYFKMIFETDHTSTQLTGYVRINGAVSVLGLITASIELYMALTYVIDKKKAYGEASLKIKVEVLCFSKSVTLHAQRTFAGSGSDPNFKMSLTSNDWSEYCAAFAA
jgi:hypothetical protein